MSRFHLSRITVPAALAAAAGVPAAAVARGCGQRGSDHLHGH